MERVVNFMEMRHALSLCRRYGEADLAARISKANRFYVRLTNMVFGTGALAAPSQYHVTGSVCLSLSKVRNDDPTSRVLLAHYATHMCTGSADGVAELLLNITFLRNTMSKEITKLCASGAVPWLRLHGGRITEASKESADNMFLALQGRVFFKFVEPMRGWSKAPRRGWSELVSELVSFASRARSLAEIWLTGGEQTIARVSEEIRRIPGFGGSRAAGGAE